MQNLAHYPTEKVQECTFREDIDMSIVNPTPRDDNKFVVRLLAFVLAGTVLFAQGSEIGIQMYLGVFKPQEHFAFFTTWASIMAALCAGWILVQPRMARWQLWLLGNLAVSATIVGSVYWLLVRTPGYWYVSSELLLHGAVPVMTVALFLTFSWYHREMFSPQLPIIWIIMPLTYAAFVVIVGITSGWYPYDFLNAGKYGWMHTGQMMLLILLGACVVSVILRALVALRLRFRGVVT